MGVLLVWCLLGCDAGAAGDGETCTSPITSYVLGTIPAREPDGPFTAMQDGDQVPLEFGSQASWMVVATVRLDALPRDEERLDVEGRITQADGQVLSAPPARGLPITARDDGYFYATGLFLPLEADDPVLRRFGWDGREASITVTATDSCGAATTLTRQVVLRVP